MNSKQFLKEGFLEDAQEAHSDHEVQMARVDCYYAAEHAIVLHKLLRNISEEQGLEGWVASKITLANDYLKSVREHLEYQMMNVDAGEDDFLPLAEGLKPVKKNSVVESTASVAEDEEEKFQDFERGPWYVILKGKAVTVNGVPKKFNWLNGAKTYFRSMMDKNPEMAQKIKREYDEASDKKSVIYYTKNLPADNTTSTEQPVSEGEKPGLWANIRAKRKRIKGGSGERMRKPGSKGAPSDKDLKSIRAASESVVKEGDLHSDFGDIVQKVKGEWEAKRAKERQGMGPKYAPEQSRAELESRLRDLESEFDPAYQYSDDYSFWTKQNAIAREIASIKKKLGSQGVAEGNGDPDIKPGMRVSQGTVVKVDGNTVTVKASNGELTTVNIHDIQQGVAKGLDPDTQRLEQEVRDALANGDDYTAKSLVKMAQTAADRNYLRKIIRQEMYGTGPGQGGVAEGSDQNQLDKIVSNTDTVLQSSGMKRQGFDVVPDATQTGVRGSITPSALNMVKSNLARAKNISTTAGVKPSPDPVPLKQPWQVTDKDFGVNESKVDEACWKGYRKEGMKTMFGKKYPNCVKNTKSVKEVTDKKISETTAGSIAGVVNPKIKNKSKVGTLFGGTYKQQKDK